MKVGEEPRQGECMPRLKPIDFNLIKRGDVAEIMKMTEDLCRTRPRGASRRLNDQDYVNVGGYCNHTNWRIFPATSNEIENGEWGYTDEQIYTFCEAIGETGEWASEWTFSSHCSYKMDWYGAKRTRRTARLYARCRQQYRRYLKTTPRTDKVYQVRTTHRADVEIDTIRYGVSTMIRAASEAEAKMVFGTVFGAMYPESTSGYGGYSCSFQKMGSESATVEHNNKMSAELQKQLAALETAKEKLEEEILRLQMGIEAMQTFTVDQFAAE